MSTVTVVVTIEVPARKEDEFGFLGRRRHGNGDYYREVALKLLTADPVAYIDNALVEGE